MLVCTGLVWFDLLHSGTLWPDFLDYALDRFGLICCVSGLVIQGFCAKIITSASIVVEVFLMGIF